MEKSDTQIGVFWKISGFPCLPEADRSPAGGRPELRADEGNPLETEVKSSMLLRHAGGPGGRAIFQVKTLVFGGPQTVIFM